MPETNDAALVVAESDDAKGAGRGKGKVSKDALAELVAMTPDQFAEHMKSGQRELWEILQYRLKKEANTLGAHQLVILYGILTDKINAPSSAVQQLHQHNHITVNGLSRADALKALGVATKGMATGRQNLPSEQMNTIPLRVSSPISEVRPIAKRQGKETSSGDDQSLDINGNNA